jgi:hypothetical protein
LPLLENGKWKLEFCWWHHNQPPSEKEGWESVKSRMLKNFKGPVKKKGRITKF